MKKARIPFGMRASRLVDVGGVEPPSPDVPPCSVLHASWDPVLPGRLHHRRQGGRRNAFDGLGCHLDHILIPEESGKDHVRLDHAGSEIEPVTKVSDYIVVGF